MPKIIKESDAILNINKKILNLYNKKGIKIEFLGFKNNRWSGNTTKLVLKIGNKIWDTTNYNSFISKDNDYSTKLNDKLTENEAINLVKLKCKELSTKNEVITFLGWNNGFHGWVTKLILENSIYGKWNNTKLRNFLNNGVSKPNRLDKFYAEKNIRSICKEISTPEETIEFKGWKNNKFTGSSSKLILYNSRLNEEWDSVNYNEFTNYKSKTPKLTEDIAISRIKKKCKELSIPEEIINFLGFSETWKGSKTKLKLYNSKLDITWDYTTYDSFIYQSAKRPTIFGEDHYLSTIDNICKEISTLNEIIEFKGWVGGRYNDKNTKLILYNSKYDITWDTTSYSNFIKSKNKLPNKSEGKKLLSKENFDKAYYTTLSTLDEFIEKYEKKFPNSKERYDLSEAIYIKSHIKFAAICHEKDLDGNEHGIFYITPSNLYAGYGCPKCSGRYQYTTEDYIKKASILHNNFYKYDKTKYTRGEDNIIVTCPIHGDFLVTATSHINVLRGCPICSSPKGEIIIHRILSQLGIRFDYQYKLNSENLTDCPNKGYVEIDYYLEYNGRKIFIEFNGQQHYGFVYLFHREISNFHRQLLRDLSVVNYARENGIELLEIPYCDLSRVPEILDAFLERGENITTYVPRDLLSGLSLPLGLPLLK